MIKYKEYMKKILKYPEGAEKEGRLQAIIDLNNNEVNFKNLNKAKFVTSGFSDSFNNYEKLYWSAYLDTYEALLMEE